MSIETLELGYLIMAERPNLAAVARGMADTQQDADCAVRRTLRAAWRNRESIQDQGQLITQLYGRLRSELRGLAPWTA